MSRIYFHAKDEEAEVGADRAMMGSIVNRVAEVLLDLDTHDNRDHWILPLIGVGGTHEQFLISSLRHGSGKLKVGDKEFEQFTLALNSALKLGSRAVKLAARLHGQCEIHAWVDDQNRGWFADVIEEALAAHVIRDDMGWDDVIALMRKPGVGPVFTSYSVTNQFPGGVLPYDNETDEYIGGWDEAVAKMREEGRSLEIKPDNFDTYYFNDGSDYETLHEAVVAMKGAA